jgi:hypothetical protein
VVDAYLSPILRRYVATVAGELGAGGATSSPTPNPSPQGGGERTACAARGRRDPRDSRGCPRDNVLQLFALRRDTSFTRA